MNRDQRLLLLFHRSASPWQAIISYLDMAVRPKSRARYRRLAAVSQIMRLSLADSDDVVRIELPKSKRPIGRFSPAWIVLGVLLVVIFFEWRDYTLPMIVNWIRSTAKSCGL